MLLTISQNLQENICVGFSFSVKVFFCEFCKTFKNTYFTEHLRVTASIPNIFLVFLWKATIKSWSYYAYSYGIYALFLLIQKNRNMDYQKVEQSTFLLI